MFRAPERGDRQAVSKSAGEKRFVYGLTNVNRYGRPANRTETLPSLGLQKQFGDFYAVRLSGWIHPPKTGVAAMNPTPDGKMPAESRCSPREIQNYLGRISGPLLDRIDLHVEVPAVQFQDITSSRLGESSAQIRARVVRQRQQHRLNEGERV